MKASANEQMDRDRNQNEWNNLRGSDGELSTSVEQKKKKKTTSDGWQVHFAMCCSPHVARTRAHLHIQLLWLCSFYSRLTLLIRSHDGSAENHFSRLVHSHFFSSLQQLGFSRRFCVLDFNLPAIIYSNVLHSKYFSPSFFFQRFRMCGRHSTGAQNNSFVFLVFGFDWNYAFVRFFCCYRIVACITATAHRTVQSNMWIRRFRHF